MTQEPQPLSQGIARMIRDYPAGHRMHELGQALADAQRQCQLRQRAVLKYDDLREALTEPPLRYTKPRMWNGWIPPRLILPWSDEEPLHDGKGWVNERNKRARGEHENDSPRRVALVAIASEAWKREHWHAPECLP